MLFIMLFIMLLIIIIIIIIIDSCNFAYTMCFLLWHIYGTNDISYNTKNSIVYKRIVMKIKFSY
jgi:hypothetical protein